ncbi:MAG: outer membrane lipoprotein LolB [Gammaproteobacteria bacterium]|nr:outer membrane lipoprotein LolB [Gammaproteobacteria bacterium]
MTHRTVQGPGRSAEQAQTFRKLPRYLAIFYCALSVAGCAVQPPGPVADRAAVWQARSARLAGVTHWILKGRIAVQLEREGWTATLHWEQRPDNYVLRVSAPLGRGTFELTGTPDGVTLQTSDNRLYHADQPESLLQQTLGWQLPVSGLYYWVRGMPDPGSRFDVLDLDDQGRINDLIQDGWQVNYERYRLAGDLELPGKITLENERLRVRLVISDWILSS